MIEFRNEFGKILIGKKEELFTCSMKLIGQAREEAGKGAVIGLSGGSTPKALYRWVVAQGSRFQNLCRECRWTVSDERCLPLESDESNFGTADRLLLRPLGVPEANKIPWQVELSPPVAAKRFQETWRENIGEGPRKGFDLCFLGLGEDCHTASLFPGSPLIGRHEKELFAAVEAPGKGWRLSITEAGLNRCGNIVVMATGQSKADALERVMKGPLNPHEKPAQVLGRVLAPVIWLLDEEAASGLQRP